MQDFETLYDEKISSIQGNEIVDEYFMSLLRTHSFVELLKSLYYSPQDADISSIYLKCMKQGYRMCDLQRAFVFLLMNGMMVQFALSLLKVIIKEILFA